MAEIERRHIVDVLLPIWSSKTRTAKDVRSIVEDVLDRAYAHRNIGRHNPARWDKGLKSMLPKQTVKAAKFPALAYPQVSRFMEELRQREGNNARALEFLILTACRSGEARGATWREIDWDRKLWIIPGSRMKKSEEHRVPLSKASLSLLKAQPQGEPGDLIFPSFTGKQFQDTRLSEFTRDIGSAMERSVSVHGFRATFRTWGEEETEHATPILEMALAHKISDDVKAAYQRGDLVKKRRALMDQWAAHCTTPNPTGNVMPMRAQG